VVEEPQPHTPHVQKSKGLLKSKEREAQRIAAAAAEAAAAAALQSLVVIKQLDGLAVTTACQQVRGCWCCVGLGWVGLGWVGLLAVCR